MLSFSSNCDEILFFNPTQFGIKIDKKTWCEAYTELKKKSIDEIFRENLFTYEKISTGEFGDEFLTLSINHFNESQRKGFNNLIVKDIVMMRMSPNDPKYKEYGAKFIKRMYMCCLINGSEYTKTKKINGEEYITVFKAKIDKLSKFFSFCDYFMKYNFHSQIYESPAAIAEAVSDNPGNPEIPDAIAEADYKTDGIHVASVNEYIENPMVTQMATQMATRIGGKKTKRRRNKKTKSRRRRRHTRN